MKYKLVLILAFFIVHKRAEAIKPIIKPNTGKSRQVIVDKQNELLKRLEESKGKLDKIKLGSLYGKIGMFYQSHEFDDAAKLCYENAIELSPYDFRWYHLKGFVESSLGNFKESEAAYKKVTKINPDYLPSKIRLAELDIDRGLFENSKTLLQQVITIAPKFARAYVDLGTVEMQLGESEKAIQNYQQALKLQPSASQVHYLLFQAYASIGDEENSKKHLAQKGSKEVVMFDSLVQEMHLHSVSPSYYAQASINAFKNLDYPLAEKLVNRAIELDPDDVNIQLIKLNVFITTKGKEESLAFARNLVKKHPNNYRVVYSMAMLFEITGNDDSAIKWYEKELKFHSTDKSTYILLAKAHMRKKQYNKALVALRKSNTLEGENIYSIYAEAVILSHFKMCDASIKKFYEAIAKKPKSFTYLTAFVKTVGVCSVKDPKILADALNAARNMYKVSPSIKVVQALAMIEAANGNKTNAVDFQTQTIYMGLLQKLPKNIMNVLQADLDLYNQGKSAKDAIKFYDVDINPARSYNLYQ